MKKEGNAAMFLSDATKDILESALNDLDINPTKEDMIDSEAYVLLHRDNPETKEILGSVNLRLPFVVDDETKEILKGMNVPMEKVFLTCFGIFDASDPKLDISIRCSARNEHGYPISYATDSVKRKIEGLSAKLTQTIRREIKEDLGYLIDG